MNIERHTDECMKQNRNPYEVLTCEAVMSYKKSQEKPSISNTVDTEKNLIRYEAETLNSLLNDQTAAKTSIDFLVKYTAQLKIQQIKRRLQIAAVDLDMVGKLNNMGPLLQ